ncbi:MAG: hypothetical protein ABR515_01210 [Nitrososphaeraceae archaeon]
MREHIFEFIFIIIISGVVTFFVLSNSNGILTKTDSKVENIAASLTSATEILIRSIISNFMTAGQIFLELANYTTQSPKVLNGT